MAAVKKYSVLENAVVYPSNEETIEVIKDEKYKGAHKYRAKMCLGYNNKKKEVVYSDKIDTIQFVKVNEDGSVTPGWQSEQLVLILLDRVKKLNAVYPSEQNEKQIKGLQMFLDACKERVDERLSRNVFGELKK